MDGHVELLPRLLLPGLYLQLYMTARMRSDTIRCSTQMNLCHRFIMLQGLNEVGPSVWVERELRYQVITVRSKAVCVCSKTCRHMLKNRSVHAEKPVCSCWKTGLCMLKSQSAYAEMPVCICRIASLRMPKNQSVYPEKVGCVKDHYHI